MSFFSCCFNKRAVQQVAAPIEHHNVIDLTKELPNTNEGLEMAHWEVANRMSSVNKHLQRTISNLNYAKDKDDLQKIMMYSKERSKLLSTLRFLSNKLLEIEQKQDGLSIKKESP